MREIKFRAWEKSYKRMSKVTEIKWKEEHLYHQIFTQAIVNNKRIDDSYTYDFSGVSNGIVLMQYTGLKDKNGVEIYEDDVVWCRAGEHLRGIWEYEKQFIVEYGWSQSMWEMSLCDEIEVIGNIHDNPELMEG